ncbi:MAG: hybrid sensor histidine kinase/response regulator [Anaerolineae bacterium]|nr:hybrid sensor histidine kinase/response regulator [Anaerolineae bacterium]
MSLSENIRRKLIATFQTEQREHLQTMMQGLLALEREPDSPQRQALLDEIFREAHSLKGSARAVGMTAVESVGHALEELLSLTKDGRLPFTPDLFDLLYQSLDAVELLVTQVESGSGATPASVLTLLARLEAAAQQSVVAAADAPSPNQVDTAVPRSSQPTDHPLNQVTTRPMDETIRVTVSKLDALMVQLSELLAVKIRTGQRLAEVGQLQQLATAWQKDWLAQRAHFHRLVRLTPEGGDGEAEAASGQPEAASGRASLPKELLPLLEFLGRNQEQLRHFSTQTGALQRQFAHDLLRLSLIIDELEAEVKRVRLLPLTTITTPFDRMVRDLARQQDKRVALVITGGETELDKRLLEQIKDPLLHLLRNAVDHGIEPTAVRQQSNKPPQATITVSAGQQGNNVVITVQDDGVGLDVARLRDTAVRRQLFTPAEAAALTDAEAANLIFRAGFSTSARVTDISGRGVGLDVARQNVETLHGSLTVTFASGRGTTFTMILPLTLTSSRGLLLLAGGQTFALPLTTVERLLFVQPEAITRLEGREVIVEQDQPIALAHLANLLELPAPPAPLDRLTVAIIGVAEKRLALVVDSLVGEQELVIKSLGGQLARVGGLMGATMLGSGQIVLVLHAADLLKLAARPVIGNRLSVNGKSQSPITDYRTPITKTILVVDDSITTRTLEKNILEAQGYQVRLATNGEEALGLLVTEAHLPDVIVTDVNMPRLDGFDLTRRVKLDTRTKDIPVILVTSRDSPADKARGIEVGADAYIVKNRFDQGNLLAMIEQLTL